MCEFLPLPLTLQQVLYDSQLLHPPPRWGEVMFSPASVYVGSLYIDICL